MASKKPKSSRTSRRTQPSDEELGETQTERCGPRDVAGILASCENRQRRGAADGVDDTKVTAVPPRRGPIQGSTRARPNATNSTKEEGV